MNDKRNIIEDLKNFKEQFILNNSDTKRAENLAAELYDDKNKKEESKSQDSVLVVARKHYFTIIIAVLFVMCAIFLSILLPIVLKNNLGNSIKYYDTNQIDLTEIDDIESFIGENNLMCQYYKGNTIANKFFAGYVIENNQLVYLQQQSMIVMTTGFDILELNVLLTQDKFQTFENFTNFTDQIRVDEILVEYKIENQNGMYNIYAFFNDITVSYFLKISTQSTENKLEQYVSDIF